MVQEFLQHAARSSRGSMHVKIPVWRALALGGSLSAMGVALGVAILPFVVETQHVPIRGRPTGRVSPSFLSKAEPPALPAHASERASKDEHAPVWEREDADPAMATVSTRPASARRVLPDEHTKVAAPELADAARVRHTNHECELSFVLDERGRKRFKPECVAQSGHSARPAAQCEPNFELDERGRKRFKPECFLTSER